MEHKCKSNSYGWMAEIVNHDSPIWFLETDGRCCRTEINYCPFCGIKLEGIKDASENN